MMRLEELSHQSLVRRAGTTEQLRGGFRMRKYADFSLLSLIGQQRSSPAYARDQEFLNENTCEFERLHKINS